VKKWRLRETCTYEVRAPSREKAEQVFLEFIEFGPSRYRRGAEPPVRLTGIPEREIEEL
jgi:hypothetical protein